MDDSHFRKLERMYHDAPVNRLYGNRLEVSEGSATLTWDVDPRFFHSLSALHGSAYFKLLDDAAFFAANSVVTDVFVLTASFNVHFLQPVVGGALRAEGGLISAGRKLLVAEATIYDDQGNEVAVGSGSFAPSGVPLDPKIGYRIA